MPSDDPRRKLIAEASFFDRHAGGIQPEPNSGCWLWDGAESHGYGRVRVGKKRARVHRVALAEKLGRGLLPGEQANHHCDVKCCVNPDHLYAGTQSDNMRDMNKRGRHSQGLVPGELHGNSKLTAADVLDIRRRRSNGEPGVRVARDFGISPGTVSKIILRQRWGHI